MAVNPSLNEIIEVLKRQQNELQAQGVLHVAVFGSRARGDYNSNSDIDLLVDLDPNRPVDLFGYVALAQYVEDIFSPLSVDMSNREALRPHIRPYAEEGAVYAF